MLNLLNIEIIDKSFNILFISNKYIYLYILLIQKFK